MVRIVFMSRLDYLLDFGLSLELLLGAMYRRRTNHPLDYIYAGLRDKAITKKTKVWLYSTNGRILFFE